jgi:CxxC motif-containing protein (DUF1111 family)
MQVVVSRGVVAGALVLLLGSASVSCSRQESSPDFDDGGALPSTVVNASDVPIDGVGSELARAFDLGDALFDLPFREADGLGPLFVRTACSSCHEEGARGPGLVQKMSIVLADGITASSDQSRLPFGHTVRQGLAAGASTAIVPPAGDPTVKVSIRLGPPLLGRGYVEAIADAEIERVAAEQRSRLDGIRGRVQRVTYGSRTNAEGDSIFRHAPGETGLIGRLGLKARIATLDDFVADAFQGDMGMTTPMRPEELPNPDRLTDDRRPGVDVSLEHVNRIALYLRLIAIPKRIGLTDAGRALFDRAACNACHVPSMKTRADHPLAVLAGVDAPIYSDLLLHDMGASLADGVREGDASSRDWRTTPLIGLRFSKTFLHDGRATTIEAAIEAHDGEAHAASETFRALRTEERRTLLAFVEAL